MPRSVPSERLSEELQYYKWLNKCIRFFFGFFFKQKEDFFSVWCFVGGSPSRESFSVRKSLTTSRSAESLQSLETQYWICRKLPTSTLLKNSKIIFWNISTFPSLTSYSSLYLPCLLMSCYDIIGETTLKSFYRAKSLLLLSQKSPITEPKVFSYHWAKSILLLGQFWKCQSQKFPASANVEKTLKNCEGGKTTTYKYIYSVINCIQVITIN